MRVVLQRVSEASVRVEGKIVGEIGNGLLLLVGIAPGDGDKELAWMADKVAGLRIFEDDAGKMNLSVEEVRGAILSVSQFTLYGDCRKGRRPNFLGAAKPEIASELYDRFNGLLREKGFEVATGVFGAMMAVSLVNDGPVTLILDSPE
ncbi:D-aminoacyl-tRNA deacylase [Cohnella thailandensis]|uniref:D-aminoacyl-tRNA deacylase n=1 Tax=Cohnella thailandensis TaxID=557557 RepID=A0A841STP7_9BACL|nr:D-tyrosyl-tRNA(Tyr) deacylase [Cohnella thailandensis]MBP1972649.1 D-tyrosyl-tRNA(Tyr) deacylase [Cohnella thailandensis]